jgi:cupin 2 domain-containing protein
MPAIKRNNIFAGLPTAREKEAFKALAKGRNFRIERIVSCGQATPEKRWLREKTAEWVIVLKGRARLLFKGSRRRFRLKSGDYMFIPPNTSHRVDWTHPGKKTIWLAIHLK